MRGTVLADVSRLKAHLARLSFLDGRALRLAEGLHLVWLTGVADANALQAACEQDEGIPLALLRRAARHGRDPVRVDGPLLAAALRDLKAVRGTRYRLELARKSPALRKYGACDDDWLEAREARVAQLSALLHAGPEPAAAPGRLPAPLLDLVAALRGAPASAALEEFARRGWEAWFGAERLRERVVALRRARQGGARGFANCLTFAEVLQAAAAAVGDDPKPGPGRDRAIREAARRLVAWPFALEGLGPCPSLPDAPLPRRTGPAIEQAGAEAIAALASGRWPPIRRHLHRLLSELGLMFECDGAAPPPLEEVSRQLAIWPLAPALDAFAGRRLSLAQALRLASWPPLRREEGPVLERCAALLEQGFTFEQLQHLSDEVAGSDSLTPLSRLPDLKDDGALLAWAQWYARLAAARARIGLSLDGRRRHLLRDAADALGTARSAPASLEEVLDDRGPGELPKEQRELASWLGDDRDLRRLLRLQRLAGQEPVPSRRLLGEFQSELSLRAQLAHLEALPRPLPAQRRRREAIRARLTSGELPGPGRTLRRIREAVGPARSRALLHQLEAGVRASFSARFGAAPAVLTEGWLEAARYLRGAAEQPEVLERLIRFAAAHPGEPSVRALPGNAAWTHRANAHLDVAAWLAHREREVVLGQRTYRLSTEEDPIEILRMGVPFRTCLSIERRLPGRSPALNAADANKRLLYLRDGTGRIVARKLLAVSSDWKLLGYRLYSALRPALQPALEEAFGALCAELANDCGIPLGAAGRPEPIHAGQWYDDGAIPFDGDDAVARYCRLLGRSFADAPPLRNEALRWDALEREAVDELVGLLPIRDPDPSSVAQGDWVLERLGFEETLRRAAKAPALFEPLFRRAGAQGVDAVLALLERSRGAEAAAWQACFWLWQLPRRPGSALRLARVARRSARSRGGPREEGMEWISQFLAPGLLCVDPLPAVFEAADALAPVWEAYERRWPNPRWPTADRWFDGALFAYETEPQPLALLRCLESPRASDLALRTAVRVAATFELPAPLRPRLGRALAELAQRRPVHAGLEAFAEATAAAAGRSAPESASRLLSVIEGPDDAVATEALERFCAARRREGELAVAILRFVRPGRLLPASAALAQALSGWDSGELGALRHAWATPELRDALAHAFCGDASDGGIEQFCAVALGSDEARAAFVRELFTRERPWFQCAIFTPWIRALELEVALELGAVRCIDMLKFLPGVAAASAFIDRVVARYPTPPPAETPGLELDLKDFRHRWLMEAWAAGAARP